MPFELVQINLSSPIFIAATLVIIAGIILLVVLLIRSSAANREGEARMRQQFMTTEREGYFAASVDRIPHSRESAESASRIADLLREQLSMRVTAVYAGRDTDSNLVRVFSTDESADLAASVPATLLKEYRRPSMAEIAVVAGEQPGSRQPSEGQPESRLASEETDSELANALAAVDAEQWASPGVSSSRVMLLPWWGPFHWVGLIVASGPAGVIGDLAETHADALTRLTDRLGVALEFEHADAVASASDARASRTTRFARSLVACLEEAAPLDAIVREVTNLTGSDSAALWRTSDADGMVRMVSAHGLKQPEFLPLPVGQGLAGSIAQSREMLAIEDAPADPRCIFPREARESGIVAYLGAPLIAGDKTVGVIEAHCAGRREWNDHDRRALESAATIIAELVKSTDSRGNRLKVESAYLGLSEALQRLRSADEVKEAVVEVLGHALGASRVLVVEIDDENKAGSVKQEYRQPSAKSAVGASFGEALAAGVTALQSGESIVLTDSREKSLMTPDLVESLSVLSELALPIRVEGKTRGVLYVHQCDRTREWDEDEVEFAERVVRQLALSLSNLRSLELASSDAKEARAETRRIGELNSEAPARIRELEQRVEALDRSLAESRAAEEELRGNLARSATLEAETKREVDSLRASESEARDLAGRALDEQKQAQASAQQLLEINRLKSEFIVNAGHEIEGSLQSVLGLAELLERGSYGELTGEQREALKGVYGWARRIKVDVDWLIEYGSARSRRLEPSQGS